VERCRRTGDKTRFMTEPRQLSPPAGIRPISRRQALAGLGGLGVTALLAACGQSGKSPGAAAGACVVVPELTEGPYYIDGEKVRSDIREDRPGTPLSLAIRVRNLAGCTPRANAVVDVWHCDATGNYSGFESQSSGANGGGPGGGNGPTDTKRYLRGSQITGADGIARFITIYPGWYRGRTVHVHVKVHIGNSQVVTTQLFFDEAVTRAVYASGPYAGHTGQDTTNASDGIFARANLLTPVRHGDGYLAAVNLDVKTA
jgi:protocatechuate 3,4-dioxygenase beta subunit